MSYVKKVKKSKKGEFGLDDLTSFKSQSLMMGFLAKNKGVVLTVGIVFLILVSDIVLTFLMAFKLI